MRRRVLLAGLLPLVPFAVACAATGSAEDTGSVKAALGTGDALVISQIYGGGGNVGAPYTADYVELFNRGNASVSLAGASLQYGSATSSTYGAVVALPDFTLEAGKHFLVRFGSPSNPVGVDLPVAADATSSANLGATAGKILLSTGATPGRVRHRLRGRGDGHRPRRLWLDRERLRGRVRPCRKQHERALPEGPGLHRHGPQRRGLHDRGAGKLA